MLIGGKFQFQVEQYLESLCFQVKILHNPNENGMLGNEKWFSNHKLF